MAPPVRPCANRAGASFATLTTRPRLLEARCASTWSASPPPRTPTSPRCRDEQFDAALDLRLVGAERIAVHRARVLRTRSRFAEHIHEVLDPRPADHGGRHAARLAHRRDRAPRSPSLVDTGPQQPARAARDRRRSTSQRVGEGGRSVSRRDGRLALTPRASRASSTTPSHRWLPDADDRNGFVFAIPYRHAISPPAVLDAGRDPRRARRWCPTTRSGCTARVSARCRRTPTTGWAGQITCLTTEAADGTMSVQPSRGARAGLMGLSRRAG